MSASGEASGSLKEAPVPCGRAWMVGAFLPLLLALPWLVLLRGAGEMGTLRGLLLVLLLGIASVTDLLWRRIYNWTTYTIFGWVVLLQILSIALGGENALASSFVTSLGMLPWRESLMGFVAGFAILFVLYNLFRGGAGDLKLVAVLGALVGLNRIIEVLIYAYILAGVFAACLVVGVAGPIPLLAYAARSIGLGGASSKPAATMKDCLKRQVPMAPFIAGGTLLALFTP